MDLERLGEKRIVRYPVRFIQGVGTVAALIFGLFCACMIALLIGSLFYHAFIKGDFGHEEDSETASHSARSINPTPIKEDGEPSYEFEQEDIERAEAAPESVQRYCEGAVSEAQEVGCLSHVEPSEVP